jgi:hypothetical protein
VHRTYPRQEGEGREECEGNIEGKIVRERERERERERGRERE